MAVTTTTNEIEQARTMLAKGENKKACAPSDRRGDRLPRRRAGARDQADGRRGHGRRRHVRQEPVEGSPPAGRDCGARNRPYESSAAASLPSRVRAPRRSECSAQVRRTRLRPDQPGGDPPDGLRAVDVRRVRLRHHGQRDQLAVSREARRLRVHLAGAGAPAALELEPPPRRPGLADAPALRRGRSSAAAGARRPGAAPAARRRGCGRTAPGRRRWCVTGPRSA